MVYLKQTIYYTIEKSDQKNKKYMVVLYDKNKEKIKTINFGDSRYQDFTIHQDEQRKTRYIQRHRSIENWMNYKSAGFMSRWLLWNKKTIQESIDDAEQRFNLKCIGNYI